MANFFFCLKGDSGGPLMIVTNSSVQSYDLVGKEKFDKFLLLHRLYVISSLKTNKIVKFEISINSFFQVSSRLVGPIKPWIAVASVTRAFMREWIVI